MKEKSLSIENGKVCCVVLSLRQLQITFLFDFQLLNRSLKKRIVRIADFRSQLALMRYQQGIWRKEPSRGCVVHHVQQREAHTTDTGRVNKLWADQIAWMEKLKGKDNISNAELMWMHTFVKHCISRWETHVTSDRFITFSPEVVKIGEETSRDRFTASWKNISPNPRMRVWML